MSAADSTTRRVSAATWIWLVLAIAGSGLWIMLVTSGEADRAWRALLSNFIFFTSLAGGLVVWPAVAQTCNGRWHSGVEHLAASGISFSLPSLLVLVLLWFGSPSWSPWYGIEHHQGIWLNNSFLFARDLAALFLFWAAAWIFIIRRRTGEARITGGILIVVYCLVFSLLGFDLVMALDPRWFSTLAGGYFFISGLYIAAACWAFLCSCESERSATERHDLGRLVLCFSLMTAYLMYSHLLPIWYENLPHEVRFPMNRIKPPSWRIVSFILLATVYLGPLVMLLTEWAKRNRITLGMISLIILVGMWGERWWLIAPTFEKASRLGMVELSAAAALSGILGLGIGLYRRFGPHLMRFGKEE
ncbi:hypothetical protein [Pelotalea chapellei]|uniref:Quinol:cytochrome c oxidoreductase quinone-binding subunit 2 n=1 Tax=Pelotalea chapellei TaxID=44671 RepID=A0ABS5U760_9BACT|nr:hypothetical protein [Pelotalea chapellei]MBT1071504.1 hypothetical protein [Pelotalea chapellei]